MTTALIDTLKRSMKHSSVPYGLIDVHSQRLDFCNSALERVLERHRITAGSLPGHALDALAAPIAQCLATHSEQSHTWAGSQTRLTLTPLLDGDTVLAIQCIAHEDTDAQVRRLAQTLHRLPVGVWLAKPDGEIYWVNQANPAYSPQADDNYYQTAEWIKNIHPDDLVTCASSFSKAAVKGKVDPFEFRMLAPDRTMHWYFVDGGPIVNDDGTVDRWAGVTLDIQHVKDAQRHDQQEIERLETTARSEALHLQQVSSELSRVQKMELVGQLAGSIAHDFNNLLFVIRLNTGILLRATQESKTREYAELIQRDVARAARTASELMTFSGRQPQLAQAYDTASLVGDIEDLLRRAAGAEVDFALELEPDLPPIEVDRTYFENALINLTVNARDAVAGKGRVRLAFRKHQRQHEGQTRDYLQIEISDNGCGMSEATQARVFEPFFTTKEVGKGTGLGLSMVAHFVEQCGGCIELASTLGQGTRVQLHLPRSAQGTPTIAEETIDFVGGTENLLLIEDDLHVRNALAQLLIDMGYVVSTAYAPEIALQFIRNGLRPDMIISDIRMPGRITAIEMVRQLDAAQHLPPVLFMTGYAPDVVIEEGLIDGRYPVIYKPVSAEELAAKVREVLDGKKPVTGASRI